MNQADLDDLHATIDRLKDRLDEIEDHQWWANGRIRQEVISGKYAAGTSALIAFAMWARIDFSWWYVGAYAALSSFVVGIEVGKAMDQERRRSR